MLIKWSYNIFRTKFDEDANKVWVSIVFTTLKQDARTDKTTAVTISASQCFAVVVVITKKPMKWTYCSDGSSKQTPGEEGGRRGWDSWLTGESGGKVASWTATVGHGSSALTSGPRIGWGAGFLFTFPLATSNNWLSLFLYWFLPFPEMKTTSLCL